MAKYKQNTKMADNAVTAHAARVMKAYSQNDLARICAMGEGQFERRFNMVKTMVDQKAPADFFLFKDNGANILAVAHLDTVGAANERRAHFVNTEAGPVVYSRALDDRLGAYIILDMLPKLGINVDVLLTVGEESGQSTAAFFESEKEYNWMIEFDRGGTDVVLYHYDSPELCKKVRDSGARVGHGSFSDISYMDALKIKGINWGVGYQEYHGPRAHAYLHDTFMMMCYFIQFHEVNADVSMPHTGRQSLKSSKYKNDYGWSDWSDSWDSNRYNGGRSLPLDPKRFPPDRWERWDEWREKYKVKYSNEEWDKFMKETYGLEPYKEYRDRNKSTTSAAIPAAPSYGLGTPTPVKSTSLTLYHGLGFDGEDSIDHEVILGSESLEDAETEGSEHSKKVDDYEGAVAFLAAEQEKDCDNPYVFNHERSYG